MFGIIASGYPRDHILLASGSEGQNEQIFSVFFARKCHRDVIRLHLLFAFFKQFGGEYPFVFFIVEDAHVGHVVGGVLCHLAHEQARRVAQMALQVGGHLIERMEQVGEGGGVGLDDGVFFVGKVVGHIARVRIDGDFDGVTNVIKTAVCDWCRIGEIRTLRVRIKHPHQIAIIGDDDVWVIFQCQERGDFLHPIYDLAMVLDACVVVDAII